MQLFEYASVLSLLPLSLHIMDDSVGLQMTRQSQGI